MGLVIVGISDQIGSWADEGCEECERAAEKALAAEQSTAPSASVPRPFFAPGSVLMLLE